MATVFLKVVMIFCIVAVGYAANKAGVLPVESNKYLVNLLLYISIPAMIIDSMSENPLTPEMKRATLEVFLGTLIWFFAVWLLGLLVLKILRYQPPEDQGVLLALMSSVNSGFMGFPVTASIFGSQALYFMVIENCTCVFYLYFLQVLQLNYGTKKRADIRAVFRSLCNMCMLAALIGLILLITGIRLPEIASDFFGILADATVPVSMIVLGIQLSNSNLKSAFTDRKLIIVCLVNVVLVPVLTFLGCNWLPLTNWAKLTLVFASAFPGAVISVAIAARENKNADLMAKGIAMTTLMSLATLPVAAMALMELYM